MAITNSTSEMARSLATQEARNPLPNIVLVMTDQQRADYLGCYGHKTLQTPHLDSLAATGTRFERCYVASPVCMPNRSSIMTGRMPSAHRVRMNGISLPSHENTFVELLRLRGYKTALIGKSHLQNMVDHKPYIEPATLAAGMWQAPPDYREALRPNSGYDYQQEMPERWRSTVPMPVDRSFYGFEHVKFCTGHGDLAGGHYYQWLRKQVESPDMLRGPTHGLPHNYTSPQAWRTKVPEELYPTSYIADQAERFVRKHAARGQTDPFFLTMSFPDPHHPFTPPGRYWDMYKPDEQELPVSFNCSDDVLPQVQWARAQRRLHPDASAGYGAFAIHERQAREAIALTCGMITMIDSAVGRLLETLRVTGKAKDTIIIFASDHGDLLGDHGLMLKGPVHLQSLIRVPLIWHDPQRPTAKRVSSALGSSIDIAATILERVGIAPYNGMQGRSLLPAMCPASTQYGGRDSVLIEEDAQNADLGFTRTVVTGRPVRSLTDLKRGRLG